MSHCVSSRVPSVTITFRQVKEWLEDRVVYSAIKEEFERTSRFAKLAKMDPILSGTLLFLRFEATTGDAMGMNMVSKAANASMKYIMSKIHDKFPNIRAKYSSLSGNMCVDKKASAINW